MERRSEERVVKVPLPVPLIREVDEALVAGLGGYTTRAEFFREAAQSLLLDLKYEPAPDEPRARRSADAERDVPGIDDHRASEAIAEAVGLSASEPFADLRQTVLRLGGPGHVIDGGEAEVAPGPLFGMHNRDYPSLWVAYRLADHSARGPVNYAAFVDTVTAEAWDYAESLQRLEASVGLKLTALFPTNRDKPQSASEGFRAFAIGSVSNGKGGERIRSEGPLFSWRICQVVRGHDGALSLGLTPEGWRLLTELHGVSLSLPHSREHAELFLAHLSRYAKDDWWGFAVVLSAVAQSPTRLELVEAFRSARPDWTDSLASTNAQGYIARAREWGLIEAKQVAGRYAMTDFGSDYFRRVTDDDAAGIKDGGSHE
jgi:hypothetical protein